MDVLDSLAECPPERPAVTVGPGWLAVVPLPAKLLVSQRVAGSGAAAATPPRSAKACVLSSAALCFPWLVAVLYEEEPGT